MRPLPVALTVAALGVLGIAILRTARRRPWGAPLFVTVDTNQLDPEPIERLWAACRHSPVRVEFRTVSVNERERGDSRGLQTVPESGVWGESNWGGAVWASEASASLVEEALAVMTNGSFPLVGDRDELSANQRRKLRDAMMLEAHVRQGHHVLVTCDKDLTGERTRGRLQALGRTWLLRPSEFIELARSGDLEDLRTSPPVAI